MVHLDMSDYMAHGHRVTHADAGITCVDDVPSAARLAERQQFLHKWDYAVGSAPLFLVAVIVSKFFPDSTSRVFDALAFTSVAWGMAVAGFTFFLLFLLKGPRCH